MSYRSFCVARRAVMVAVVLATSGMAYAQKSSAPLRTGVDAAFAPHAMVKLGGGLQGFNIDLGEALAKEMGRKIQIDGTEFSALIPAMNSGKYDFVLAPVTVTREKAENMLFSEPYLDSDYTFVVKKDAAPIAKLDDLRGKTLAVNKGSNYETWARDNASKYGFKFDIYGTNADAIQAVQSGKADVNLGGVTVSAWAAKHNPAVKTTLTIKSGLVWSIAFRKDDKAGRDAMNMALKCLKQKGVVAALAQKWFDYKPAADAYAVKIVPGYGVPGLPGYEDVPVTLKCPS